MYSVHIAADAAQCSPPTQQPSLPLVDGQSPRIFAILAVPMLVTRSKSGRRSQEWHESDNNTTSFRHGHHLIGRKVAAIRRPLPTRCVWWGGRLSMGSCWPVILSLIPFISDLAHPRSCSSLCDEIIDRWPLFLRTMYLADIYRPSPWLASNQYLCPAGSCQNKTSPPSDRPTASSTARPSLTSSTR